MNRVLDAQRSRLRDQLDASRAAVEKLRELRLRAESAATPAELLDVGAELPGQIADLARRIGS